MRSVLSRQGITHDEQVIQHIIDWYRPGAVVLQMGADSLAGDKLGGFNLTLEGELGCSRWLRDTSLTTQDMPSAPDLSKALDYRR